MITHELKKKNNIPEFYIFPIILFGIVIVSRDFWKITMWTYATAE